MIYAGTDFFLALFKETDWLKSQAHSLLNQYGGRLWTSSAGPVELLLIVQREGLDPERIMRSLLQVAEVRGVTGIVLLHAAFLMKELDFRPMDALHAAHCIAAGDPIVSSDAVFERAGVERVPLEE